MNNVEVAILLSLIAGLSTGIGSLIAFFIKDLKHSYLSFSLGFSAGVMIYISLVEMLNEAISQIGFLFANICFFGGMLFIYFIDVLIPHEYIEEHVANHSKENAKIMKAGLLIALGLFIHNMPEGLAVFLGSVKDLALGIPLAIAIAVHNIPEGISVSMPIYYATKDRMKAFIYSFLSGIAEPVAAVLGALFLYPFLTPQLLNIMIAGVAGIMVFISFDEVLPLSMSRGEEHVAIAGIVLGMFVMSLSLYMIG